MNWPNYLFITWPGALLVYRQHASSLMYKNINVQNDVKLEIHLFVMNFNSIVPFMGVNVKLEESTESTG